VSAAELVLGAVLLGVGCGVLAVLAVGPLLIWLATHERTHG
jgi:hypothetical protein